MTNLQSNNLKDKLIEHYDNWLINKCLLFEQASFLECGNIIKNSKILIARKTYKIKLSFFILILNEDSYSLFLQTDKLYRKYNFELEIDNKYGNMLTSLKMNNNGFLYLVKGNYSIKTFDASDYIFLRNLSKLVNNEELNCYIKLINCFIKNF